MTDDTDSMDAEIIAIGTELLLGFTVNTDTVFLGRALAGLGISCYHQVTVGDNPRRLAEAIRTALSRADLVITCGGLGPTVDDITLETIASATGRRLILNRATLKRIRDRFARHKIPMPKTNVRQAMIPEGAVVFNEVGTAPGFMLKLKPIELMSQRVDESKRATPHAHPFTHPLIHSPTHQLLVALPGPPAELIPMVERALVPRLRRYAGNQVIRSRTLKTTGLTESEVDVKVRDLLNLKGKVTVGIYAHPSQVDLRITAKAESPQAADRLIRRVERTLRRRLGTLIFGAEEETLEEAVGKLLKKKRLTLAAAESCTGGLVQHRITEVPGSSDYFRGGVIAYANQMKESTLGVPHPLIEKHGAVSGPVAKGMAAGVRKLAQSDLGLGITGIAGPTGGTKTKPVGLVFIALATPKGTQLYRHRFSGSRSIIKFKASQTALNLVRLHLVSSRGPRKRAVADSSQ